MVLLSDQSGGDLALDSEEDDNPNGKRRKVHFAAFDGSAMQPPSDVLEDSYKEQQECILQLTKVQKASAVVLSAGDPAVVVRST